MNDVPEGPGQALQAARESMEISVREVADVLNLPIATIEAIEVNDYENLPAAVFTRGYIRAYAKLLELDADAVVARFSANDNEIESAEADPSGLWPGLLRTHPQLVPGVAGLAALIGLISIAVWLWPATGEREPITAEAPPGIKAAVEEPEISIQQQIPVEPAAPSPSPDVQVESSIEIRPATGEALIATTDLEPPSSQRITPTGGDRLEFRFSEDCWVEIKSATGASLFSDLGRSGGSLELVGQAPFRILLGYAPGASMSFNAEAVALAPHTRNNVANLVLGQ